MGRPKGTLPVGGGDTFVTRIVRTLAAAAIEDVVIVVGHDADAIMDTRSRGPICRPGSSRTPITSRVNSRRCSQAFESSIGRASSRRSSRWSTFRWSLSPRCVLSSSATWPRMRRSCGARMVISMVIGSDRRSSISICHGSQRAPKRVVRTLGEQYRVDDDGAFPPAIDRAGGVRTTPPADVVQAFTSRPPSSRCPALLPACTHHKVRWPTGVLVQSRP